MNYTDIAAAPNKAPINFLRVQLLQVDAPTQTPKQAEAGFNIQKITAVEAETKQQIVLWIIRGDLHMNDDMVGNHLTFIGATPGSLVKAEYEGNWWVQASSGVQINPYNPAPAAPVEIVPPPAAAPVAAPAPAPEPVASPTPEPEPEPEPQGIILHPGLIKFARGQVLCRMAAAQEFKAAGFEVSPDALGGVATSLFIQLSQKGLLDDVIAAGFPAQQKSAAKPVTPPAAKPAPTRPAAAVERPAAVVTPQAAPAPAAPAPKPAAVTEPVRPVPAPAAKPAGSKTPEEALAKYDELLRRGDMKDAVMSSFQSTRTDLAIPWADSAALVTAWVTAKHGQAAVDAVKESMSKVFRGDAEKMDKGMTCAPYVFMAKVEERAKAAK